MVPNVDRFCALLIWCYILPCTGSVFEGWLPFCGAALASTPFGHFPVC